MHECSSHGQTFAALTNRSRTHAMWPCSTWHGVQVHAAVKPSTGHGAQWRGVPRARGRLGWVAACNTIKRRAELDRTRPVACIVLLC